MGRTGAKAAPGLPSLVPASVLGHGCNVVEHLDREYVLVGTQQFDGRFGTTLFVRRDRVPEGVYDPFGWPCFGPGTVQP